MERAMAAFEEIHAAPHERVVVVSHGGTLSGAFKGLLKIPAQINPFSLYNASINELHWGSRIKLMSLNQVEHLRELDSHATGDM
jgi:broad specificity phosphatase PhoE